MTKLVVLVVALFATQVNAQDLSKEEVDLLLKSKDFVFTPQTVHPMGGGTRQVTPDFDLTVSFDSVISYLPYFGRAFSVMPGEPGISFSSSRFAYRIREVKKGWEVYIKPGDNRDIRLLQLTVFKNGYANLFVNSNNRQAINYYGYIKKRG